MKILNFGSLNLDMVYSVEHFVRAGETLSSQGMEVFCGGKGLNQSIALARAGAEVYHAGCVGIDGEPLIRALKDSGADTGFIKTIAAPSGHAIIQVDSRGQNCILLFGGANQKNTREYINEVLSFFSFGDILLLQNEINDPEYILLRAHERGLNIAVNPSPIKENLKDFPFEHVRWLILNEIEAAEISGETETEKILATLKQKYPKSEIILTLGRDGAVYANSEISCRQDIFEVPVVDTTSAGDTFTGYFLHCVSGGKQPKDALRIATAASAISVSRKGASPSIPEMTEVLDFLKKI